MVQRQIISSVLPRPSRVPNNVIIFYLYIIGTADFLISQALRSY